jgi:L-fuculose-phosphate aldolase
MKTTPELVAYISGVMFSRYLTDISGGNVSARENDLIYCTPRYAGQKWHWHLEAEDIVSGPIEGDTLLQSPSFSREGRSHLAIYRAFPDVQGIIHAHPPHVLAFCAIGKPIEPVLEGTKKFGTLKYHDPAPAYSQQQADSIVEKLREQKDLMKTAAAAVLMPHHGIILAGNDLWSCIDSLERININAWCIIAQKLISESGI